MEHIKNTVRSSTTKTLFDPIIDSFSNDIGTLHRPFSGKLLIYGGRAPANLLVTMLGIILLGAIRDAKCMMVGK